MPFSKETIEKLKARLLRAEAADFKLTSAEVAELGLETDLTPVQVSTWITKTHWYYTPYEHEKISHLDKIKRFLSNTKVNARSTRSNSFPCFS